eukprot:Nitzschia sp. Nitz4//scaffold13_size275219//42115//44327//NITZ4_000846-RA/size275219-augustus-gene-0.251-mRNA-1//-1//CDS//3329535930//2646//frame0
MTGQEQKPPTATIVVTKTSNGFLPPPVDTLHRAVHKIKLSALSHNYMEVESVAQRQRCDVICVTKADSYGHGAVETALYLADNMGASAFAVATLEEAITLRKAFQQTASVLPALPKVGVPHVNSLFQAPSDDLTLSTLPTTSQATNGTRVPRRSLRPNFIRILVLGPPVGFPRCFDDYYHHNIEAMISGPEVARALYEWVHDSDERKRTQVERAASEAKELALKAQRCPAPRPPPPYRQASPIVDRQDSTNASDASNSETSTNSETRQRFHPPSATLGNVTGSDLAREVRKILKNQKLSAEIQQNEQMASYGTSRHTRQSSSGGSITPISGTQRISPVSSDVDLTKATESNVNGTPQVFAGIEEAARSSRNLQKAVASDLCRDSGDDDEAGDEPSSPIKRISSNNRLSKLHPIPNPTTRKRLRWHAMVDSGMGRLGFRTDPVSREELGKRRDSVEVIKELVDLESKLDCPVEFFGMVTHMADANSTSTYTNSQIAKFKTLLKRVRAAGISVPTISTDNSAALLTPTLTHFDPKELLSQEFTDTRGFVRVGGAIYGQRPAFPQLQAVSTLMASVRHVATLRKGESVGYDRAYVAERDVRIATLTIGFADGYPRELGNSNGQVAIRGMIFPVVGNICMDMMMVELGDAGDKLSAGAQVVVGDTAILWGPADDEEGEGLVKLKDIAQKLKTTQSALTCGLDKDRVLRKYA